MLFRPALLLALLPALAEGQQSTTGDVFTWSGRVASGATLGIKHFNGPIDVREGSGDRVELRADRRSRRGEDMTFEVENHGANITICSVWRGRNICDDDRRGWGWGGDNSPPSTRLTILLPKGVRLEASTGNGAIVVDKASNDVELHTGNGDVRLSMTAGTVDVTSGNGELEIEGASGPVRASTGNGRVFVTTGSGPVNVRTGNGAIDVRMKTISGEGDMSFSTGNGSVTVALPESFNGEIDASTGHGDFRSDFEIRVLGRLNPRRVRGTIGTGSGRLIRMSTGNGPLELRKS
jgi:DUF4097 and DUF4098 domain-containing protein YvlB